MVTKRRKLDDPPMRVSEGQLLSSDEDQDEEGKTTFDCLLGMDSDLRERIAQKYEVRQIREVNNEDEVDMTQSNNIDDLIC